MVAATAAIRTPFIQISLFFRQWDGNAGRRLYVQREARALTCRIGASSTGGASRQVTVSRNSGGLAFAALLAALIVALEALAQPDPFPGMPPVPDPKNLYSETGAGKLSPAVEGHLELVYVPHVTSDDVYVIDQKTYKVIDKYKVGLNPQHVVPSWDLQTLWVTNNAEGTHKGSLTPIDPRTGKPGVPIPVADPYNMYFTPDG